MSNLSEKYRTVEHKWQIRKFDGIDFLIDDRTIHRHLAFLPKQLDKGSFSRSPTSTTTPFYKQIT